MKLQPEDEIRLATLQAIVRESFAALDAGDYDEYDSDTLDRFLDSLTP